MAPWEKDTWHENHVVWKVPPKACFHVTHGTRWMDHLKTHGHERDKRKREETSSSQAKSKKNGWVRGEREEIKKKKKEKK